MQNYTYLQTQLAVNGVATVSLNRPKLHNAFDEVLISELTECLQTLEAMPEVRLVILRAEGSSFSAGADLNWMQRMAKYSEAENFKDAMNLAELMKTLNFLKKPTLAMVHGAAFGGGVGLVACCDVVLATENASFCLSEVKLGLIPAVISPYVMAAIGERAARRYFLTAERFDVHTARRLGLVHEVVSDAPALQAKTDELVKILLQNSPNAVTAAKDLIYAVSAVKIDDALITETARRIAKIRASEQGKQGLSAFLEKRKPDWIVE